ncbi:MAG: hypothetical protein ACYS5V_14345, partial [Planctomycetota bacterium]
MAYAACVRRIALLALFTVTAGVLPARADTLKYGDLLCFDSMRGSLIGVDPDTGQRTLISGYGMGPTPVGSGPLWTTTHHIHYSDNRLTQGPEGVVWLFHDDDLFSIDARTGDRKKFDVPDADRYALLPDDTDPDRALLVISIREDQGGKAHSRRKTYELNRATGQLRYLTTDLTIPWAEYWGRAWTGGLVRDSLGQVFHYGNRYDGTDTLARGPFVYDSLAAPPIQTVTGSVIMQNVHDVHFDPAGRRVLACGDFELYAADMDAAGTYSPFRAMDDPDKALRSFSGLCSRGQDLMGIRGETIYRLDTDAATIAPIPPAQPVGFGFAAPAQGKVSAAPALLSCGAGQLEWRDLATGALTALAAPCQPGDSVVAETADAVYVHQKGVGIVTRVIKATGATELLAAVDRDSHVSVVDETHLAECSGGLYLLNLTNMQR